MGHSTRRGSLMKQRLAIVLVVGLLLSLALFAARVGAQGTGVRYFPETGHNVQGEFLAFFDRFGGEAIFGLPRTEEMRLGELTVQYFQRVRMEYHPRNPSAYRVQLSLLGDLLGYRSPPLRSSSYSRNSDTRRYFPETGHTVCYAFLEYFDRHGGLTVFGYPITELTMERGRVVQYFQRAKLEHHRENPPDVQIVLGNLGDEYIQRERVPQSYLAPVAAIAEPQVVSQYIPTPVTPVARLPFLPEPGPSVQPVGQLQASASVKYPITGQGGYQTVYVRVTDEAGRGLQGARVQAVVHFRDGDELLRADDTGASGHSSLSFNIGYPPPGYTVIIDVNASYGGRTATAASSFIPWW
jgi:hypothetical protein